MPVLTVEFLRHSNREAQRPASEPDWTAGDRETQRARERGTALPFSVSTGLLQKV